MNYTTGDKIKVNIHDWEHHYHIESTDVKDDSFGSVLLSMVYQRIGNQSPETFERGVRPVTVEEMWFTANDKRKIERILI